METSYDGLLRKFRESEEQLKDSNVKLELSEEETIKLENQIKECEGHLHNVRKELKLKEDDLEYEKGQKTDLETHVPDCSHKIAELKVQLDNLQKELRIKKGDLENEKKRGNSETQVSDGSNKIDKLMEELEVAREKQRVSNEERKRLTDEIATRYSLNHELEGKLKEALEKSKKNDISKRWLVEWGAKRKKAMDEKMSKFDAHENNRDLVRIKLEAKKRELNSEIRSKSKLMKKLECRLEEWEPRSKVHEGKLKQSEAAKLNVEELCASEQMDLQGQISSLKEELDEVKGNAKTVKKEFDKHKKKYNMLMAEKNGANAKIDQLMAEVSSGDNEIANMEREVLQIQAQQEELISGSEARVNLADELKLRVEELVNEVPRQNAVISDRAEEKREAIRQLCISIEHYRSEYEQLLSEFAGHNLHPFGAP